MWPPSFFPRHVWPAGFWGHVMSLSMWSPPAGARMPVQAAQWTDFLSCPICLNEFNGSVHRPISLGCSHTVCKTCLHKLRRKACPFDQTPISTDVELLPVNRALLLLVGAEVSQGCCVINRVMFLSKVNYYNDWIQFKHLNVEDSAQGPNHNKLAVLGLELVSVLVTNPLL